MTKSHKRSPSKGKHRGLAEKAPMEERKSAAKTVKGQKLLFILEFFLLLWRLVRQLFNFCLREKKKEPSLSHDVASSSSALATHSGITSEEQTEILFFGTVNDTDSCHDPNSNGNSNEALTPNPEAVLESVLSHNGVMVGKIVCPYPDALPYSRKEIAKVHALEKLTTKSNSIGQEVTVVTGRKSYYDVKKKDDDLKKKHDDVKKKYDDQKKGDEVRGSSLQLREVLSNFMKKPEGKIMFAGIKEEVLKLPAAKSESIDMIIGQASYTKIVRAMHFQRANMTLKSSFWSKDWRKANRFPSFSNKSADYQWWKQNFDYPEILEKRLEILRVAAKNWNPELDMFVIIKLVSDLNSILHRQPSENERNETDEIKMLRLRNRIFSLRSGGDSKI